MRKFSSDETKEYSKLGLGFRIEKVDMEDGAGGDEEGEEKKKMMEMKVMRERLMMTIGEV